MIKNSVEQLAESIGYDIGMSTDNVQADLINGFSDALSHSMPNDKREMQLCYLAKHLNKNSEHVLKALVEFIDLKNKDNE